jgi:hypothetical protein
LTIILIVARRPRPATAIIAIASPLFFEAMYIRFSMSLADSEEGRSPREAEDDNKRADT